MIDTISADVAKSNEKNGCIAVLQIFIRSSYLQYVLGNYYTMLNVHLTLVSIVSILIYNNDIVHYHSWWGYFCLTDTKSVKRDECYLLTVHPLPSFPTTIARYS